MTNVAHSPTIGADLDWCLQSPEPTTPLPSITELVGRSHTERDGYSFVPDPRKRHLQAKVTPRKPRSCTRRDGYLAAVGRSTLSRHCKAFLHMAYVAWGQAQGKAMWPSRRKMAEHFGVCEGTIRNWTREAEESGWLEVVRHKARPSGPSGRWTRQVNHYTFTRPEGFRPGEKRPAPSANEVAQNPVVIEPQRGTSESAAPAVGVSGVPDVHDTPKSGDDPPPVRDFALIRRHLADARAALRGGRPPD